MSELSELVDAIADAAEAWRDPDYPRRDEAVAETLEAGNSFTEEAVAFAVNQQTSLLTREGLNLWIRDRRAPIPCTIGVLNAGNIPLVELQDFLAVVLTGNRYRGTWSTKSPALLSSFIDDVRRRCPALEAEFGRAPDVFAAADAVIATGSDETMQWVRDRCDEHDVATSRRLLRGHSYAVAVLDGSETDDEYERLAEDALLHEGFGCRNVALVWAPRGRSPDAMLDAFARFRGVFPPHPDTPGRLSMQRAFLEAVEQPHAFGEGLEFLVSRGDPEEQTPGHIRWSEYDDLADVAVWLRAHSEEIQLATARASIREKLSDVVRTLPFGDAQRPTLGWCPDGIDTVDFLVGLETP